MKGLSAASKLYIALVIAVGTGLLFEGLHRWECADPLRFICYLLVSLPASGLKVRLPGVTGTLSVSYLFILVGVVELSLSETMLMAALGSVLQSFWQTKRRPAAVQLAFNLACISMSAWGAYSLYHSSLYRALGSSMSLMLALTASAYFAINTLSVALVITLTENKHIRTLWQQCYFWSFPYYLLGASLVGMLTYLNRYVGWHVILLNLPVVYIVYRSYRLYLGKLEDEKRHAEDVASLHLRTIEALALAIEAKDENTHDHLQRVQHYAVEIGKELKLSAMELKALTAAAVLHDIGKLAVPEHIISKPGKLTQEEFEKMKIHPTVGADILERVQFPYPVAPIVRAHHEKWNGTGYPAGLRGEEIPIGARILSAVDCLDALASDRQYRRALPLDEAMKVVISESGKSYDPRVVEVLARRYEQLEAEVKAQNSERIKLRTDMRIDRGHAPAAGFEKTAGLQQPAQAPAETRSFISSIGAARQEVQMLFELSQDLGTSLSLQETLSVLEIRLKRLIPFHAMVLYLLRDKTLIPEFVHGENFALFSSLKIPLGEGVSGWVAANRKPIVNGNPAVESGYLNDAKLFSTLRSAMAVPLEGIDGVIGVMALYHATTDAFSRDNLRVLLAISSKVSLAVENALRFRKAEISATTDGLTGLPNASSLFLHLDAEIARCQRNQTTLTVLVCDLDGFKQVNDHFGHLAGNQVLKLVAARLRALCREYDYVARMGGDEFVMILPDIPEQAVQAKTQALADAVRSIGREICSDDVLAVSIGAATFDRDGNDAESLLAEADRRMYKIKQAGRRHRRPALGERAEPVAAEVAYSN